MYERFTDRARKVCQFANQEAQRLGVEYIGDEHLLLGLCKEGCGFAANVLKAMGVDLLGIRDETEKIVERCHGSDMVTMGRLPHTPAAKRVIETAIREAKDFGHNYVGTEHLLLGLLGDKNSTAAQILTNLGVQPEAVRSMVVEMLGKRKEEAKETAAPETPPSFHAWAIPIPVEITGTPPSANGHYLIVQQTTTYTYKFVLNDEPPPSDKPTVVEPESK